MKKIMIILTVGLFCLSAVFSQEKTGEIQVTISGLRTAKGKVLCTLYNKADGYPMEEKKALKAAEADIRDGKAVFVFSDLPYGTYAVSVFHDENANYKLDTGLFGIPTEGLGASNDAKGSFGPPQFKDAKVELSGPELILKITMVYI
ncbi:MAG: DUF2141 domain-containing protein [Spirochaetales bacterium]|nr:DUF2141 domain-containing protein [Spirochaetales bacterium]